MKGRGYRFKKVLNINAIYYAQTFKENGNNIETGSMSARLIHRMKSINVHVFVCSQYKRTAETFGS